MVRKNEYSKKSDLLKNDVPSSVSKPSNPTHKSGEYHHKESNTRNGYSSRETLQRDNNNQQKEFQRREQKRETTTRVNQARDNVQKDSITKENTTRESTTRESHQKNYHREVNVQNNKEPYRQHFQRNAIKPKTEETVDDIANDITRIEKEIDLEIKEIKSLRLGL